MSSSGPFEDEIDPKDLAALNDSLTLEKQFRGDTPPGKVTRDLLLEASPAAAQTLIALALRGSENMRYRASTWILDRALGFADMNENAGAPWEKIYDVVTITAPEDESESEVVS